MKKQEMIKHVLDTCDSTDSTSLGVTLNAMLTNEVAKVYDHVIEYGELPEGLLDAPVVKSDKVEVFPITKEMILLSIGEVKQSYNTKKDWRSLFFECANLDTVSISINRFSSDNLILVEDKDGNRSSMVDADGGSKFVLGSIYKVTYYECIADETFFIDDDGNMIESTVTANRYRDHAPAGSTKFQLEYAAYTETFRKSLNI